MPEGAVLRHAVPVMLCGVCRYTQVLRENPQSPPEVRLGLAACLYRGGKLERASAAYKRYGILCLCTAVDARTLLLMQTLVYQLDRTMYK